MMGVAELWPGREATQATFSVLLQVAGRFFSSLEPFRNGPRQWGQSPAKTGPLRSKPTIIIAAEALLFVICLVLIVRIDPADTLRQTRYA
jgi:hypothetical protein